MSALISISEAEDFEPPRARPRATTSPSRVTTVTDGCDRKIASASRAFSATTVDANKWARSSEIELERICDEIGLSPDGIFVFVALPDSYTKTSA